MAGETRKWFLLKLFTDEILKLIEKSNQIRPQRSMWRQFNGKGKNKLCHHRIHESQPVSNVIAKE